MKIEFIIVTIASVFLIVSFMKVIKRKDEKSNKVMNEKLKVMNGNLNRDIELFNITKDMSWDETCLIINAKAKDLSERENLKERILALRRLKGINM